MKIGIVTGSLNGGAGIAALRLHQAFLNNGIDSVIINKRTHNPGQKIYSSDELLYKNKFVRILRRIRATIIFNRYIKPFIKTNISFSLFSMPFSENRIDKLSILQDCDALNIHWTSNYLDLPSFLKRTNKPTFFTLHDVNYFTAGCHYFNNCDGYKKACNNCPVIEPSKQRVLNQIYEVKRDTFNKNNHYIIGISRWIENVAKESTMFNGLTTISIPNSFEVSEPEILLELENLKSQNQANTKFALVIAQHLEDERKGWKFVQDMLGDPTLTGIFWIIVGKGKVENKDNCLHLGQINSVGKLATIYSLVDFLVHPAIQDNFPNTLVESLCYGNPVVAFRTSGIVDLIEDGVNGYMADEITTKSLKRSIERMVSNLSLFDRKSISEYSKSHFSLENQASKYIEFISKNVGTI